jgi:hypothetical protein
VPGAVHGVFKDKSQPVPAGTTPAGATATAPRAD